MYVNLTTDNMHPYFYSMVIKVTPKVQIWLSLLTIKLQARFNTQWSYKCEVRQTLLSEQEDLCDHKFTPRSILSL